MPKRNQRATGRFQERSNSSALGSRPAVPVTSAFSLLLLNEPTLVGTAC